VGTLAGQAESLIVHGAARFMWRDA
jgi:hypothetical protein